MNGTEVFLGYLPEKLVNILFTGIRSSGIRSHSEIKVSSSELAFFYACEMYNKFRR